MHRSLPLTLTRAPTQTRTLTLTLALARTLSLSLTLTLSLILTLTRSHNSSGGFFVEDLSVVQCRNLRDVQYVLAKVCLTLTLTPWCA